MRYCGKADDGKPPGSEESMLRRNSRSLPYCRSKPKGGRSAGSRSGSSVLARKRDASYTKYFTGCRSGFVASNDGGSELADSTARLSDTASRADRTYVREDLSARVCILF